MRYFAILKDSLREALDAKVLYVLIGLSTLVILFVATLSFKTMSAERTMQQFFPGSSHGLPIAFALNNHKPEKIDEIVHRNMNALMFRLFNIELLSGAPDAPESEYLLTVAPGFPVFNEKNNFKVIKPEPEHVEMLRGVFRDAEELGYIQVKDVKLVEKQVGDRMEASIQAILKGTPMTFRIWAAQPNLFFGAIPVGEFSAPLGYQIYFLASLVLLVGTWVAVIVGVVITSFFIPNMLRKGTIDLLLVKPIHRWVLLVYKYIGGLVFIFLCTAYALVGIWLVLGLRSGLWANWSLTLILTTTFFFAILYAISTFVGVLTRSTVTAIMVTVGAWFAFFVIGFAHGKFENQRLIEVERAKKNNPVPEDERWGDSTMATVFNILHTISPRTSDLSHLNDLIVYSDFMTGSLADMEKFDTKKRDWGISILVSGAWICFFLGSACLWFTYKDY